MSLHCSVSLLLCHHFLMSLRNKSVLCCVTSALCYSSLNESFATSSFLVKSVLRCVTSFLCHSFVKSVISYVTYSLCLSFVKSLVCYVTSLLRQYWSHCTEIHIRDFTPLCYSFCYGTYSYCHEIIVGWIFINCISILV